MWKKSNLCNNKEIAIVFHTLNSEAIIGTKVLKARQYADQVIVLDNSSTDLTAKVAQLAGAVIIPKQDAGEMAAVKIGLELAGQNGAKIIVMMGIDEESERIPDITGPIRTQGYDMVISSNNRASNLPDKQGHIFLTRNEAAHRGYIAFLIDSLKEIDLDNPNGSAVKDIIYQQAEKNSLRIKYIEHGEKPGKQNFEQFRRYNIGVVVPAYNEELLIEETIAGIPDYVKRIYVIDDCSKDRTPEILKSMSDPRILAVRHEKNKGVGAAIVTGYKLALEDGMDIIAVMAGDNQMDPEELPRLLIPIIEGKADYTKGNRLISKDYRKGMSNWRFLGNAMLTMITKIGSGYWHITDPQNGYTAISRKGLESLNVDEIYPYYGYCNDMLIKLNASGVKVEDVAIPARYGREKSKIKYSRFIMKVAPMNFRGFLWRLKTKYIINDFHPLVFFYGASMIMLPAGILFGLWILIQKWYLIPVSQNFPLLAVFITLMGMQFLFFAMLFDMQADRSRTGNV